MDPISHTLAGAALAQTGLRRTTAMASAALLIGANLPDVDVIAYLWGETAALSFRRGWTHGLLAIAVWPVVLTAVITLWDRWRRRPAPPRRPPLRLGALFGVSMLAVATHPALDALNVYGIRWLMPFSDAWYYGDTLFIVDPWLWLILGIGTWLGSRRHRRAAPGAGRPAILALGLMAAYMWVMIAIRGEVRGSAARALPATGGPGEVLLIAPRPVNPFRRSLVAGDATTFRTGEYDLLHGGAQWAPILYRTLDAPGTAGGVLEAANTPEARRFLSWARFPTAQVRDGGSGRVLVDFLDLRYATAPGTFGALTVDLESRTPTPSEP